MLINYVGVVLGPCFAMRPRKIHEIFFPEGLPFQHERILINHPLYIRKNYQIKVCCEYKKNMHREMGRERERDRDRERGERR